MTAPVLHGPRVTSTPRTTLSALRFAAAWRTSVLLAGATVAAAVPTVWVPGLLRGPDVMNGSARGTALVAMLLGVPTLLVGGRSARRGSFAGRVVWLGAAAYLVYNAGLLLYATPFNAAFPGYVAMLGLAVATTVGVAAAVDPVEVAGSTRADRRLRPYAVFVAVIGVANALAWMGAVAPELGADQPAFLDGTGLTTNPVHIQDLALGLPVMLLGAWWLWHRRPWGVVIVGAGLTAWSIENVTVAVDQYLGHRADATSDVATMGGSMLFAVLAVPTVVVCWRFLRSLR
jgi:hypothetical protein